ncbi:MAG TPA: DUF4124 domain-containing protein [Thermodesulfobacteriota bacterium]|nr:DUF4124 domain-containing protein [Thermodesulfobacteriota bacterium]
MKVYLSKTVVISLIFICSLLIPSYAKEIYKWVDKDGLVHFTDNPSSIPEEKKDEAIIIGEIGDGTDEEVELEVLEDAPNQPEEDNSQQDLEEERKEEAIRQLWRSRALEIEAEERMILEEIEIKKKLISAKKSEVDFLLIYGYFADYSILELRNLQDYLKGLQGQLRLFEEEKAQLKEEARRAGVPPGYLRP